MLIEVEFPEAGKCSLHGIFLTLIIFMFSSGHLKRHWQKGTNTDGGNEASNEPGSHARYETSKESSYANLKKKKTRRRRRRRHLCRVIL